MRRPWWVTGRLPASPIYAIKIGTAVETAQPQVTEQKAA